ncbi:hypothetical protein GCM10027521_00520 [Amycolatopsis cihanbeyliensis]
MSRGTDLVVGGDRSAPRTEVEGLAQTRGEPRRNGANASWTARPSFGTAWIECSTQPIFRALDTGTVVVTEIAGTGDSRIVARAALIRSYIMDSMAGWESRQPWP